MNDAYDRVASMAWGTAMVAAESIRMARGPNPAPDDAPPQTDPHAG